MKTVTVDVSVVTRVQALGSTPAWARVFRFPKTFRHLWCSDGYQGFFRVGKGVGTWKGPLPPPRSSRMHGASLLLPMYRQDMVLHYVQGKFYLYLISKSSLPFQARNVRKLQKNTVQVQVTAVVGMWRCLYCKESGGEQVQTFIAFPDHVIPSLPAPRIRHFLYLKHIVSQHTTRCGWRKSDDLFPLLLQCITYFYF